MTTRKQRRKPKRLNITAISLPIYRCFVLLAVGVSPDDLIAHGRKNGMSEKYLSSEWREKVQRDIDEKSTQAFVIRYGTRNRDVLLYFREKPKKDAAGISVLAHEIAHVVDIITYDTDEQRGWFSYDGMSEPRAYLVEYLMKRAVEVLM